MGRKADAKTILIIEGLYLKRISTSPNWQASCQLRNTYLRKSTGTADERQATIGALEWFFLLRQRVELGGALLSILQQNHSTAYATLDFRQPSLPPKTEAQQQ